MTFSSLLSIRSHPVRVRGLKLDKGVWGCDHLVSHPMRVRGLKQKYLISLHRVRKVAPHVGAWIETEF